MTFATVAVTFAVAPSYCGHRCTCPDCKRDWWLFDPPTGPYIHCPFAGGRSSAARVSALDLTPLPSAPISAARHP